MQGETAMEIRRWETRTLILLMSINTLSTSVYKVSKKGFVLKCELKVLKLRTAKMLNEKWETKQSRRTVDDDTAKHRLLVLSSLAASVLLLIYVFFSLVVQYTFAQLGLGAKSS